jgi:hypothetical protein
LAPGDVAAAVPVPDAPGVVGLVVPGVAGVLDDEQPAAAATQISAAAAEYLVLDHTGVPFWPAAPHAPFSNYDDNAGTVVAAASTPGWPGPDNKPGPRHHGRGPGSGLSLGFPA